MRRSAIRAAPRAETLEDGYYWARHTRKDADENTTFIVLLDCDLWYTIGIEHPIDFDPSQIICAIKRPDH